MISPGEFIPVAEDTGLIVPLGRWVLRQATARAADWAARHPRGGRPVWVSVNVSKRQVLDPRLTADVAAALAETRLDPALLRLEVTETVVMHEPQVVAPILRRLKDFGLFFPRR